jgi:folate-binding protein YgfZ
MAGDSPDYLALREGAALQRRPQHGVLRVFESDYVDFIQRMTTNDVAGLLPGEATVTVLTSPIARILFAFTVMQRGQDFLLLSAGTDGTELGRHLHSQIFFGDKVRVENLSAHVARMRLMGPEAANLLGRAGLPAPPLARFERAGSVTVLHQQRFDLPGYEILVPAGEAEGLADRLAQAGAHPLADERAYDLRRIEVGRPHFAAEISEAFSPLEAGLAWTCAENKGCYTGQEIIARQVTYDKVTKTLVGLRSAALLAVGDEIRAEGRSVGVVTSSGVSPALGPLALAVIKRPYNQPGSALEGAVQVVSLPFSD